MSEDAGIGSRTVETPALTVRGSNHSARSHPVVTFSYEFFHFHVLFRWCVFVFIIAIFALKRALRAPLPFLLLSVAGAIAYCI